MFSCNSRQDVKPPVAEKIPQEVFGNRIDNYFWMRLGDEQKSASAPDEQTTRVIGYLNAENAYTTSVLSHTVELQNTLYNELTGRIKQEDESVPYPDNGYYYYNKYSEGKEYPVYYRKKGSVDAPDELLLDVNKIAEGQKYCSVAGLKVSRNNRYMAYSVDLISRRRYTIHFIDLQTMQPLQDKIENTSGNIIWAADNETVFYVSRDPLTLRSDRVFRHQLGNNKAEDKEVFFEDDETFSVTLRETKSRKYILLHS